MSVSESDVDHGLKVSDLFLHHHREVLSRVVQTQELHQSYVQQPVTQQGGQRGLKRKYVERTYGQTMPRGSGNYPIVDELDTLDAFELYERNVLNGYDATVGTGTKFQFTLSEKQVGVEQ